MSPQRLSTNRQTWNQRSRGGNIRDMGRGTSGAADCRRSNLKYNVPIRLMQAGNPLLYTNSIQRYAPRHYLVFSFRYLDLKLVKRAFSVRNGWWSRIRDQVVPVLLLLQAAECHLGARDVFLRVLEVLELGGGQPRYSKEAILYHHFILIDLVGLEIYAPKCPPPKQYPSACWRPCRRSRQRNRCVGRTSREEKGQSCFGRLRECGTEHTVS